MADKVKAALDRGELVVVGKDGHLAWSNTVADGHHGVAARGKAEAVIATPDGKAYAH